MYFSVHKYFTNSIQFLFLLTYTQNILHTHTHTHTNTHICEWVLQIAKYTECIFSTSCTTTFQRDPQELLCETRCN
uniref:Uncharacterized protein n=1 Tax=Octopus bimaculoides TaxID=37653 RepID=A0A0L8FHU7_OCTBM